MRLCLALVACLAAAPAAAQTYKWVDAKGVVSYSNRPPAEASRYAQPVAERISVYEADRELERAAARLAYRERIAEQEWLQRQRLMHEAELVKATLATPVEEPVVYSYPLYYRPVASGRMHGMHGKNRAPRANRLNLQDNFRRF